jgi:hypothetical protein
MKMIHQTLKNLPNDRFLRIIQATTAPNTAIYVEDAFPEGKRNPKNTNNCAEEVLYEKIIPNSHNPATDLLNIQSELLNIFTKYGTPIDE